MTGSGPLESIDSLYAQASWKALGTYVELVVADRAALGAAQALAVAHLDDVERSYSRFRDDSDLSRANAGAGSWVRVGTLLVEAVDVALDAADRTDGLVDPTLGLSLVALGYDRDLAQVQAESGPADLPALPARSGAWREVRTDPDGAIFVPFDVALDLGATGKAFAADLIAGAISHGLGTDCIISVGGDVAIGTSPGSSGHPWQIAICESPDDDPAQIVLLTVGGVATSTTVHRRWTHGAATVHHLLDPSTGQPVERTWRTASVIAETCVVANTATTAAIVLGDDAPTWLAAQGVAARLVAQDATVVTVGSWPQESPARDTVGN